LLGGLKTMKEIHGLLGVGGSGEDGALVSFQDLEP
jgi:hypothetical protein